MKKLIELYKIINFIYNSTGLKNITVYDLQNYEIDLEEVLKMELINYKDSIYKNHITDEEFKNIIKVNIVVNKKLKKLKKELEK